MTEAPEAIREIVRQAFEDAAKMSPEERKARAERFRARAKPANAPRDGEGVIVVPIRKD